MNKFIIIIYTYIFLMLSNITQAQALNLSCTDLFYSHEVYSKQKIELIKPKSTWDAFLNEKLAQKNISFNEALSLPLYFLTDEHQISLYEHFILEISKNLKLSNQDSTAPFTQKAFNIVRQKIFKNTIYWQSPELNYASDIISAFGMALDQLSKKQMRMLLPREQLSLLQQNMFLKIEALKLVPYRQNLVEGPAQFYFNYYLWILEKLSLGIVGPYEFWMHARPDINMQQSSLTQSELHQLLLKKYGFAIYTQKILDTVFKWSFRSLIFAFSILSPEISQTLWQEIQYDRTQISTASQEIFQISQKPTAELELKLSQKLHELKKQNLKPNEAQIIDLLITESDFKKSSSTPSSSHPLQK